jgi:hypothetical protein
MKFGGRGKVLQLLWKTVVREKEGPSILGLTFGKTVFTNLYKHWTIC